MSGFRRTASSNDSIIESHKGDWGDEQSDACNSDETLEPLSPRSSRKCKKLMQLNGYGEREARRAMDTITRAHGPDAIDTIADPSVEPIHSMPLPNEEAAENIERGHYPHLFHTSNSFPAPGFSQPETDYNASIFDSESPRARRSRQRRKDMNLNITLRLSLDPHLQAAGPPGVADRNDGSVEPDGESQPPLQKGREALTYNERLLDLSSSILSSPGRVIAGVGLAVTAGLAIGFCLSR